MRKIFEYVLLPIISAKAEQILDPSQCGFRPGRSVYDHVATLQEIILQHKHYHDSPPQTVFLDIKGAYDSVNRSILWDIMDSHGFANTYTRVLKSLFNHTKSRIKIDDYLSQPMKHDAGIPQGSILSPLLYSIFIDNLARKLGPEGDLQINGKDVTCLLYADDIVLVSHKPETMQRLLKICELHSYDNQYRFSPQKCRAFGENSFSIYNTPIDGAESFKYLGFIFTQEGIDWAKHFERMVQKAERTASWFASLGFRFGIHTERTNLHLYKTFIRPALEFGLPLMPKGGQGRILCKLDSFQHRVLTALLQLPVTTSRVGVTILTRIPTITRRWEELRSLWFAKTIESRKDSFLAAALRMHGNWSNIHSCFSRANSLPIFRSLQNHRRNHGSIWAVICDWTEIRDDLQREYFLRLQAIDWPELIVARSGRPSQLHSLEALPTRVKSTIIRWLLRKTITRRMCCGICGHPMSQGHILQHTPGIDDLIASQDYFAAFAAIRWSISSAK
jgi:hypothetical protein